MKEFIAGFTSFFNMRFIGQVCAAALCLGVAMAGTAWVVSFMVVRGAS